MTTQTEKAKEAREYFIQIEELCHIYAEYTSRYQMFLDRSGKMEHYNRIKYENRTEKYKKYEEMEKKIKPWKNEIKKIMENEKYCKIKMKG